MMKRKVMILSICLLLLGPFAEPAYANNALILRGVARTFVSLFEIPKTMISHSRQIMFPVGIITGAVEGSVRTVMGTLAGALDIAQGAAPYAKYLLLI